MWDTIRKRVPWGQMLWVRSREFQSIISRCFSEFIAKAINLLINIFLKASLSRNWLWAFFLKATPISNCFFESNTYQYFIWIWEVSVDTSVISASWSNLSPLLSTTSFDWWRSLFPFFLYCSANQLNHSHPVNMEILLKMSIHLK